MHPHDIHANLFVPVPSRGHLSRLNEIRFTEV